MSEFVYNIPTKVCFGKGQISNLPDIINQYGKRVLIVYGGGSIKRNGIYDTVIKMLDDAGIYHNELSGVEPNPRLTTVKKGIELCRNDNIDLLLPIGGGSTIDCSKAIAAGYYYDGDPWDFFEGKANIGQTLPIVVILTIAATGSEMDGCAVISNMDTNEKKEVLVPQLYPKASILDPTYTMSVPRYQTAAGSADIMSHVFEEYFDGSVHFYMLDRMMEGLLKTVTHYGPIACEHPDNYEARENLMWAAGWAINGFIGAGGNSRWPCHAMEHQLSAFYDVTHGHGLAVIIPVWMRYILCDKTVERFANYGRNVFGIINDDPYKTANEAIDKTEEIFKQMGLKLSLRDLGITDDSKFDVMAAQAQAYSGLENCTVPLEKKDIIEIFKRAF